jgi:hypothetical protein
MALLNESYSLDELRAYIRTSLGGGTWRIEGFEQDSSNLLDQGISEALHAYSRRCPRILYTRINTSSTNTVYKLPADMGPIYSVWRVDFVYASMTVSPFMANLVGVSPIIDVQAQDFASFLTWRKTFMRVTGVDAKYWWDEENQALRIYNPVNGAIAGVWVFAPRSFEQVRLVHKDWIRRASLANAKEKLGITRRKFGNTLPGPGGNSLTLDGDALISEAREDQTKLQDELMKFQQRVPPFFD